MSAPPELPSATSSRSRLARWTGALVFAVAMLAQAWVLELSFQLDDFRFLAERNAFAASRAIYEDPAAAGWDPFMMRWTAWGLWAAMRALAGATLSPLPYHLVSLAAHGACAVLLASVVGRLVGGARGLRAGLCAGIAFGVGTGGSQAVSWISSQPDLFSTTFAVGSLAAFVRARDSARAMAWRVAAAVLLLAALVTKTPAAIVAPVIGAVLLVSARRAFWRAELPWLVSGVGAAALCRWLYLGTLRLRYFSTESPPPHEAFEHVGSALALLGQALVPWNRNPLFEGEGPLLAELAGLDAPILAALLFLPPLLLALALRPAEGAREPSARRALASALIAALVLALPGALLYVGDASNVLSRTVYLPLTAAAAAMGITLAVLLESRRALGWLAAAVWALVLLDGRAHVVHTERAAQAQRTRTFELLHASARAHGEARPGKSLRFFYVVPSGGYAGIPNLGIHLKRAIRPPFTDYPFEIELTPLVREAALEPAIAVADLSGGSVQAFGESLEAPVPSGSASIAVRRRAARMPEARSELRLGWEGQPELAWALSSSEAGEELWAPSLPLPAHEVGCLRLDLPAGEASEGTLVLLQGAQRHAVRVSLPPSVQPRRVFVAPGGGVAQRLGPPIDAMSWRWDGGGFPLAAPPSLLPVPPRLELMGPADSDVWALDSGAAPPRFSVSWGEASPVLWLRLELALQPVPEPVSLFGDVPVDPGGAGTFSFAPSVIHAEPTLAPGIAPASPTDWYGLMETLRTGLLAAGRTRTSLEWRISAHHAGGAVAATSETRTAVLALPPTAP